MNRQSPTRRARAPTHVCPPFRRVETSSLSIIRVFLGLVLDGSIQVLLEIFVVETSDAKAACDLAVLLGYGALWLEKRAKCIKAYQKVPLRHARLFPMVLLSFKPSHVRRRAESRSKERYSGYSNYALKHTLN